MHIDALMGVPTVPGLSQVFHSAAHIQILLCQTDELRTVEMLVITATPCVLVQRLDGFAHRQRIHRRTRDLWGRFCDHGTTPLVLHAEAGCPWGLLAACNGTLEDWGDAFLAGLAG